MHGQRPVSGRKMHVQETRWAVVGEGELPKRMKTFLHFTHFDAMYTPLDGGGSTRCSGPSSKLGFGCMGLCVPPVARWFAAVLCKLLVDGTTRETTLVNPRPPVDSSSPSSSVSPKSKLDSAATSEVDADSALHGMFAPGATPDAVSAGAGVGRAEVCPLIADS